MQGKIIGVKVDGEFMTCEQSSSFNITTEMLQTASKNTGGFYEYIKGFKGWTLTVQANMTNSMRISSWDKILRKIITTTDDYFEVIWTTKVGEMESFTIKGKALIPDFTLDAPLEGSATQSITFQGSGSIAISDVNDIWTIINAMPYNADKPNIVQTWV